MNHVPTDVRIEVPPPNVTVIIPTFNRRSRLPQVLAPLANDEAVLEILVVVDGSNDGSIEWLRDAAQSDPKLKPIYLKHSLGAQAARAVGLDAAKGDFVLFLDDDVVAHPGLASYHREIHRKQAGIVVVGYLPVHLPSQRQPGQFATFLYAEEYDGRCEEYEKNSAEILRSLWWGNVSLRRHDAFTVGLVSPGLEAVYHEDQDFGLRCLESNFSGVFERSLRADHLHSRGLSGFVHDARSQGVGTVLIHQRHSKLMGPLDPHIFEEGLSRPIAAIVRIARNHLVSSVTSKILLAIITVAGQLRCYRVESNAARLLRRILQQSGALRAMALIDEGTTEANSRLVEIARRG